jgi:hypothetical protein
LLLLLLYHTAIQSGLKSMGVLCLFLSLLVRSVQGKEVRIDLLLGEVLRVLDYWDEGFNIRHVYLTVNMVVVLSNGRVIQGVTHSPAYILRKTMLPAIVEVAPARVPRLRASSSLVGHAVRHLSLSELPHFLLGEGLGYDTRVQRCPIHDIGGGVIAPESPPIGCLDHDV